MKYERQNIHIDKLLPVLYLFLIISLPTSLLDTKVLARVLTLYFPNEAEQE